MSLRIWAGYALAAVFWASPAYSQYQGGAVAPSGGYSPSMMGPTSQQGSPSAYPMAGQPQSPFAPSQGQSPYRLAERSNPVPNTPATPGPGPGANVAAPQPNEHPLMPALRWARDGLRQIQQNVRDYSAVMVKRERFDGKLSNYEYMFLKIRHQPLSVYIYFLDPPAVKGQEVIWIQGQNNGKMWAHPTGLRHKIVGTVSLDPNGAIAMRGNHYPITEIGILNMVQRLIEVGEHDAQYGECEVKFLPGAKINGRTCTCLQIVHPVPRRNFLFHIARIFVDDELNVPVRLEAYDWPSKPGAQPELIEEYTYLNMKINNGFTDLDFDINNPAYGFKAR